MGSGFWDLDLGIWIWNLDLEFGFWDLDLEFDLGIWMWGSGFWMALQAHLAAELQVVCDSEGHLSDSITVGDTVTQLCQG